jgi:hypothetical protein
MVVIFFKPLSAFVIPKLVVQRMVDSQWRLVYRMKQKLSALNLHGPDEHPS